MTQSSQNVMNEFCSGFQLAPFVTSSGLLLRSWNAISSNYAATNSNRGVRLSWNVHKDSDHDLSIIAFKATPEVPNLQPDLVPSSALKDKNIHHFDFLSTKNSPPFSVNKAAITLFYENLQMIDQLKSQITSSTRLIVTGQALGGSIAILFTLSLLDSIHLGKNRPLCITFGSPLIGDKELQRAVSRSSAWKSCFLQLVSHKDPLPRLFIKNQTSAAAGTSTQTNDYVPFGTYLFCYDTNSVCSEKPGSILELLKAMTLINDHNQRFQSAEYGDIVDKLYRKTICKDLTARGEDMSGYNSLHASIVLQLRALRFTPNMQRQQQQQNRTLVTVMERLEKDFIFQKRIKYEETRKLNESKINMALLEWYKKHCKDQNIGYFDSYKKEASRIDLDVVTVHRKLRQYWEKLVEEAELKPQKADAALRTRWLYGGTNYRRMVEPLDIAEYYRKGGKDYVKRGRSRHYQQLEELLEESQTAATSGLNSNSSDTKDVESILTFDSCFWAHVEEALLLNKQAKDEQFSSVVAEKEEAIRKLIEFEDYVYGLLKKYQVSSEIFLSGSSYMLWWNGYKEIDGVANNSNLASFMSNADNYNVRYVRRTYDFS